MSGLTTCLLEWTYLFFDQSFFSHSVNCSDRVSVKIDHGSVNRPQSNYHKLFCSMRRNPKMMFGICRFWQGTPEVFSKRWKPWSAHSRHCCRFASDRRESFGWPKAKTEETLPRLLVIRRRLRLHGQGHLARRLVSLPLPYCWGFSVAR